MKFKIYKAIKQGLAARGVDVGMDVDKDVSKCVNKCIDKDVNLENK